MQLSADLFIERLAALNEEQKLLSSGIKGHVQMLAGDIGARSLTSAPKGLEAAANYIEHVLQEIGFNFTRQEFKAEVYNTNARQAMPATVHTTRNIIAELKGSTRPNEIIILGAHYDTEYLSRGANDNASGIAALLEIAKEMRNHAKTDRTIRFVAFSNEEQPFCRTDQMGSKVYAYSCKERGDDIKAMICLETIGFYTEEQNTQKFPDPSFSALNHNTANFIAFVSNLLSAEILNKCISTFRHSVRFPSIAIAAPESMRGVDYSDHQNFWGLGYPAIMITDTAFYRYPHYHEETDTPDKLDYERLGVLTSGLIDVMKKLATAE